MTSTPVSMHAHRPITDQASWVWRRNDAGGSEVGAKQESDEKGRPKKTERPWLVLSPSDLHLGRLFCGAMMTTAQTRSRMARCVPSGSRGFVDTQHLWTYATERIQRGPEEVERGVPATVRTAIREYFTLSEGEPPHGLAQGRVVWIRLAPRPTRDSQEGPAALMQADIVEHTTLLHRLGAVPTGAARPWVLPAVVLTSNRFLPPRADYSRRGMFPLVTVVPLSTDKRLLDAGAERIPHPRHSEYVYAPVTTMLLSLDYNVSAYDGHPRVQLEQPGFEGWRVEAEVLARIIARVLNNLNVAPEVRA